MTLLAFVFCQSVVRASIGSTPEWAAYKRELAKHGSTQVEVFFPQPVNSATGDRASFQMTINPNGDFELATQLTMIKWVKNRGITIDPRHKTWSPISTVEGVPLGASMLGLVGADSHAEFEWDASWRQTREQYAARGNSRPEPTKETGYLMSSYHIDAGYAATWWFDAKTHLVTQIEWQSLGPMADYSIHRSLSIRFRFDDKSSAKIDLSPPPGYKRVR